MNFSRRLAFVGVIISILLVSVVVFVSFYLDFFGTQTIRIKNPVEFPRAKIIEVEPKKESIDESRIEESQEIPQLSMVSSLVSPFLFKIFKHVTLAPDFFLDGVGTNIDSPEFFETQDYRSTLLLVSAKGNNLVEVWKYPFIGNEQMPFEKETLPNGLAIDQKRDWLLVGDPEKQEVGVYSLPDFKRLKNFGKDKLKSGETNMDIFDRKDGGATVFVTESHRVRGFDADTGKELISFQPRVDSIEEVLVDDYYGVLYVPDEDGVISNLYPGGGVAAYLPDGREYFKKGTNVFARGVFEGDAEGVAIYKCLNENNQDSGHGFLVFADQAGSRQNGLEFFNRETWKHLGTLTLSGVSMTDGLGSTQMNFPNYPMGLLAVSNADKNVAIISWEKIFAATGLNCNKSE